MNAELLLKYPAANVLVWIGELGLGSEISGNKHTAATG
jgi:hypothetical protein